MNRFEVLLLGGGIAGLSAALRLARTGVAVCLVTKNSDPMENNSRYAQGGIVARGLENDAALLTRDIIEAGDKINYVEGCRTAGRGRARSGPLPVGGGA